MAQKSNEVAITVFVTLDQRKAINDLCTKAGVSRSQYIREMIYQADIHSVLAAKQSINDRIKDDALKEKG